MGLTPGWSSSRDCRRHSLGQGHQRHQSNRAYSRSHDPAGSRRSYDCKGTRHMTTSRHQSSRELESEASAVRARLSNNLDELANNLTPGRVLDEVMTYSRGGG